MGANEKHEAAYHGGDYTPSERTLEGAWASYRHTPYQTRAVSEAEFARFIAKIKAEAWDEGVGDSESLMCMTPPCGSCKNCDTPLINPYK